MGRDTGRLREEEIKSRLLAAGALGVGIAKAEPVAQEVMETYDLWIADGKHAGMDYMANHREIRRDPRLLLDGAQSIISMAFSYNSDVKRDETLPRIAKYAFLPDYHKWVRKLVRKSGIGELLGEEHKEWRICVDSAPIFERYWSEKSGVGIIGRNGSLIVPGAGCEVILAEIVSTQHLAPDMPLNNSCGECNLCSRECPSGALGSDGTIDCNRCLSYLTIEHRGERTDARHIEALSTEAGRSTMFGCDRCVSVCPHNNASLRTMVEPLPEVVTFRGGDAPPGSCLKRAGRKL